MTQKQVLAEIFRDTIAPKTIETLIARGINREGALKFFLDPLDKMEIPEEHKQELTRLATLAVNNFFNKLDRIQEGQNILGQITQSENDAVSIYKKALADVLEGKNLEKWESDANAAIKEINSLIEKSKGNTEPYKKIKYELYGLKELIAQRKEQQ